MGVAGLEQEDRPFSVLGLVRQDVDRAVWLLTLDATSAGTDIDVQTVRSNGDAPFRSNLDGRAHAPDGWPHEAAGRGT